MDLVELPYEYMFKYSAVLGGGERQMVAIKRARWRRTPLIVLDEPTSALDVRAGQDHQHTASPAEGNAAFLPFHHARSELDAQRRKPRGHHVPSARLRRSRRRRISSAIRGTRTRRCCFPILTVSRDEEAYRPERSIARRNPGVLNVPPGCSFNTRCPFAFDRCLGGPRHDREQRRAHGTLPPVRNTKG